LAEAKLPLSRLRAEPSQSKRPGTHGDVCYDIEAKDAEGNVSRSALMRVFLA
jgi:hypothetical protein